MQPSESVINDIVDREKKLQEAIKSLCEFEEVYNGINKQLSIKKVEKAELLAEIAKLNQSLEGYSATIQKAKSNISVIRSELRELNELKWRPE
jgi:uncharacterized coiled-coil DUF342 family protein